MASKKLGIILGPLRRSEGLEDPLLLKFLGIIPVLALILSNPAKNSYKLFLFARPNTQYLGISFTFSKKFSEKFLATTSSPRKESTPHARGVVPHTRFPEVQRQ